MDNQGFFVSREIFNEDFFRAEAFTQREAYIYMLSRAACNISNSGGKTDLFGFCTSYKELSRVFSWSRGRVRRYISRLVSCGYISMNLDRSNKYFSIICKKYKFTENDQNGHTNGHTKPTDSQIVPQSGGHTNGHTRYTQGDFFEQKLDYRYNNNISKDILINNILNNNIKNNNISNDIYSKIPFEKIIAAWNALCPSLPHVRMTDSKKKKVSVRCKEWRKYFESEDYVQIASDIFKKIEESDFLTGRSGRWQANFEWLFSNSSNWEKVVEGNYSNRKAPLTNKERSQIGTYIDDNPSRWDGITSENAYNI